MKSIANSGMQPIGIPLLADNITEFHAARVLLLLKVCGTKNTIEGLTKLAKLDFFVRYPLFFNEVATYLLQSGSEKKQMAVESAMVRHHYGPWDKRYYHVLPFLEAKGLIAVKKKDKAYEFALTEKGQLVAKSLLSMNVYNDLVNHMKEVKGTLGRRSGTSLKNLIYEIFDKEVVQKHLGEIIE
jgi:DNA-binding PadR family transcriptional regulator